MGQRTPYRIHFTRVEGDCQEDLYKRKEKNCSKSAKTTKEPGDSTGPFAERVSNFSLAGNLPPKVALALPLGELAKIFDF